MTWHELEGEPARPLNVDDELAKNSSNAQNAARSRRKRRHRGQKGEGGWPVGRVLACFVDNFAGEWATKYLYFFYTQ